MNLSQGIIGVIFNLIICFGVPIGYLVYIVVTKKKLAKAYFIGMLAFFISQICLRIPMLQVLPKAQWYTTMVAFYPVIYAIFLGLTAGIFEEVARFLGFKVGLKKDRSWNHGIAFGMGHGGIEAILITGIANINNLVMLIHIGNGTFDSNRFGITEEVFKASIQGVGIMGVALGGIERIFAMMIHVGLTLVVLYGINKGRQLYIWIAILIHGIVDGVLVVLMQNSFGLSIVMGWVMVSALSLFIFSIKSKKIFRGVGKNEEVI